MDRALNIGLVAGEASGDVLGAALIGALRERRPDARFVGLAGEHMRAAGCEALGDASELAVMGLVEPLAHLPRLLKLRARLKREFIERRIDVFVGVDAPAFNLGLARALRARGVATAQYVSPQVWAWRRGRVKSIAGAVDAVLCLLPFEPECYAGHPVRAEFVGHPLADRIPLESQRDEARRALGVSAQELVVAVLPGSREGEVRRLGPDFAAATVLLQHKLGRPLHFLAPMASASLASLFAVQLQDAGAQVQLLPGQADQVLAAADVGLIASGTATLQGLLHGLPMVVAYRLAPLTAFIVRDLGLVKLQYFSLPNLLAGEPLVPEFFQDQVKPEPLADALHAALIDAPRREALQSRFLEIHEQLQGGGAGRAAELLLQLLAPEGDGRQVSLPR
jgi:lipid-A-disaccharide synthase